MPEKYRGKSMLDIYDDLRASPRYPAEVVGISVFRTELDEQVKRSVLDQGEKVTTVYQTPPSIR